MNQIVSFPGIGIGEITLNRVAFYLFDKPIYWYGVIIAAAFLAAVTYLLWRVRLFGLDSDRVLDVVLGTVIGGIIGARLYYVAFSGEQYSFWEIFQIREGGIAVYGSILGGAASAYFMCKWRKVRFLPMADLLVGGVILGQAIGRWGNFVNVEAFGSNTTAPWGMVSPSITEYLMRNQGILEAQGMMVDPAMPVHPTFFYESVWCLLGFLLIAWFTTRRRFDGELTLIYFAWYGLGRSVIEGLRTDSLMWGSLRVSQMLAVALVVVSVTVLVYIRSAIKKSKDPDYKKLYVHTQEGQAILAGTFYPKTGKQKQKPSDDGQQEQPQGDIGEDDKNESNDN